MRRKRKDDDEHQYTQVRTSQDQHRPVAVGQPGYGGGGLWPLSTNGTGYNDKHVKWLLKLLEKNAFIMLYSARHSL